MNRGPLRWKLPLIACVIALSISLVYPPFGSDGEGGQEGKLKLGLDLQGGMHLVLRVMTETLPLESQEGATERALEIIRNRIDQFGVSEPMIQRQGKNQLVLQLPGIADRQRALDLIGKTALLEFKLASAGSPVSLEEGGEGLPAGSSLYPHENGSQMLLNDRVLLKGESLKDASVQYSSNWNEPVVAISFDSDGAKAFGDVTSRNVGRQLAIVLDGVVQSAPVINEPILSGDAQITGSFTVQEAGDLAIALRAGALPAPIEIEEERTVGPTLGQDSIDQGLKATMYAGLLVIAFMAIYYLGSGLIANAAILFNILMIGAALAYFKGTLTLPGIAGIILTIGMAVDTNVLIIERIREELRTGKTVLASAAAGYKKAFSAILDSNVTTLLTALILFRFGTGPIRGFALTLAIGIVGSFFNGVFVTRAIYEFVFSQFNVKKIPMMAFLKHVPHIGFMKLKNAFLVLSLCLVGTSVFWIGSHAQGALGVDFTGGTLQEYRFNESVSVQEVRSVLQNANVENVVIQEFGSSDDLIIRSSKEFGDQVHNAIADKFASLDPERVRIETVGPVIGKELRKKALSAILASLAMILVYLAFRFELRYSMAAIGALLHDATICLFFVILTGREISIPVLAALLTIVGYSVNDTIVIFDRVRENIRRGTRKPLKDTVNISINESLSRTLLTSLTTLLAVTALYLFGGPVINDFAFTMIIGVIVGTYSTVYIASPIVIMWPGKKKA